MKVKNMLIFMLLLSVFLSGLYAQRQRMNAAERLKQLNGTLNLTEEQSAKIKLILENSESEMKKLRELNDGDFSAMRAGMREIGQKSRQQIENVLDDAQKLKYQDIQNQRRNSGRRNGGRQIEDLKTKLDLSEEQVAQITPILEQARAELEEIRVNREGGRRSMMRKMKKTEEVTDKKIEALLSPEQIEIYQKYKKEMQKMRPENRGSRRW